MSLVARRRAGGCGGAWFQQSNRAMNSPALIRVLFVVAAVYDGVIGAAFLTRGARLFELSGVVPPNHPGYVQFPAALLLVFALMFARVAINPAANRQLIPYGMLLKISYCGVVCFHWFTAGLPWIWKPFCIADVAFLVLFAWAYVVLGGVGGRQPRPA